MFTNDRVQIVGGSDGLDGATGTIVISEKGCSRAYVLLDRPPVTGGEQTVLVDAKRLVTENGDKPELLTVKRRQPHFKGEKPRVQCPCGKWFVPKIEFGIPRKFCGAACPVLRAQSKHNALTVVPGSSPKKHKATPRPADACQHHWQLDYLCFGTCQKCGEQKQFQRYPFMTGGKVR